MSKDTKNTGTAQTTAHASNDDAGGEKLSMLDEIIRDNDFLPAEPDFPMVGFSDVAEEEKGEGDFTSIGFAKIHDGWTCVGYLTSIGVVESEFDSEAGRRRQRIFHIKGTVRAKLADADKTADVSGTVKLPQYARLRESLTQILKAEQKEGKKICIKITYMGKAPDTMKEDGITVKRSGAHLWDVRRMKVVGGK